jgi:protein phosphatase
MGGAQAGELASMLAAQALEQRPDREPGGEAQVEKLIQEANRRVHERANDDPSASGMGTTITVALFAESDGSVTIGHVGDSRAYRLRGGELEQLTQDHSLVAELVRRGELSEAEAEVHPQRSVITRALGTDPDVDVDAFTIPAEAGDVYLLCSDGLTTMVDSNGIAELVSRHRNDLRQATLALIAAANDHGGDDNVTAVLFDVATADGRGGDTVEAPAVAAAAADPDEADTLHPEDRVAAPAAAAAASTDAPAGEATEELPAFDDPLRSDGDTMVVSAAAMAAAADGEDPVLETEEGEAEQDEAPAEPQEPGAPLWRYALNVVVIAVLVVVIYLLVTKGLAR